MILPLLPWFSVWSTPLRCMSRCHGTCLRECCWFSWWHRRVMRCCRSARSGWWGTIVWDRVSLRQIPLQKRSSRCRDMLRSGHWSYLSHLRIWRCRGWQAAASAAPWVWLRRPGTLFLLWSGMPAVRGCGRAWEYLSIGRRVNRWGLSLQRVKEDRHPVFPPSGLEGQRCC